MIIEYYLFDFRLSQSALNNEFLTKACHEWKERLVGGDFTPESLQRAKADIEKDKNNVDPWKVISKVNVHSLLDEISNMFQNIFMH